MHATDGRHVIMHTHAAVLLQIAKLPSITLERNRELGIWYKCLTFTNFPVQTLRNLRIELEFRRRSFLAVEILRHFRVERMLRGEYQDFVAESVTFVFFLAEKRIFRPHGFEESFLVNPGKEGQHLAMRTSSR